MDYLITPELGGADNIQNLWPEPYSSNGWDAHVKDALEDRLHRMVCEGKIDLVTAQREMAGDWISAYKKYFHTDKPPSSIPPTPQGSLRLKSRLATLDCAETRPVPFRAQAHPELWI